VFKILCLFDDNVLYTNTKIFSVANRVTWLVFRDVRVEYYFNFSTFDIIMDKSWMYFAPRSSSQYVNGVEYFLNFAFEKSSQHGGEILCPCTNCHNRFRLKREKVHDHLICVGFKRGYLNWTDHRESYEVSSSSMMENDEEGDNEHEMNEILHDLFPTASMEEYGVTKLEFKAKSSLVNTIWFSGKIFCTIEEDV
jgi:hypothetical protein